MRGEAALVMRAVDGGQVNDEMLNSTGYEKLGGLA
jgi:hypothetical protein